MADDVSAGREDSPVSQLGRRLSGMWGDNGPPTEAKKWLKHKAAIGKRSTTEKMNRAIFLKNHKVLSFPEAKASDAFKAYLKAEEVFLKTEECLLASYAELAGLSPFAASLAAGARAFAVDGALGNTLLCREFELLKSAQAEGSSSQQPVALKAEAYEAMSAEVAALELQRPKYQDERPDVELPEVGGGTVGLASLARASSAASEPDEAAPPLSPRAAVFVMVGMSKRHHLGSCDLKPASCMRGRDVDRRPMTTVKLSRNESINLV
ncbi:hypothetical protein EMIHUDRAFT_449309 [Emiliania huxleyi CCMP1516]|uniref:BAR domain-containing protein n=2 Tax=Emiliania huxleyi TaxID=2903 RepID=A0A0D3KEP5_EMIH1|nr:hypothetical protein EMIHUDRAFT_449309 [Emiliania huxleyi CCMP1516]EOD34230.1 hypothetical protein EMIHUDRAFT_449309 [Emiliania huxleyi CCMP1516]|eukprot:XP_005786659.1 hypothetical protein EMIHUDRAFT_449309 [Emiliania huxleyi CCMP1516]